MWRACPFGEAFATPRFAPRRTWGTGLQSPEQFIAMMATSVGGSVELSYDRAVQADMVGLEQAAALANVTTIQLRGWTSMARPRVIALDHPSLGLRFPRWQFEAPLRSVVRDLSQAMGGSSWARLAWLESGNGAFQGRTPRTALEHGESVEHVLNVARYAD